MQDQLENDSGTLNTLWELTVLPLFFCLSTLLSPEDQKFP